MTQLIDLTWEVGGVNADGKATIQQTIGPVRFKAVTPRETAEYDTDSGVAPEEPRVKAIRPGSTPWSGHASRRTSTRTDS